MSALARIRKTALQHEQERQYDKALALYARLLDGAEAGEEEVDVALYNRAGDLALRVGDTPRALGYFERALDLYAAGGLLNNAVALGVKILRHAPGHLSAHYTLGVLYGRKGFAGDARHHLLTYAVQMQRAGRADEAARVLGEVAAACLDAAERRAALDAYGALGGDPAHAAALASPAPLADAAPSVVRHVGDVPAQDAWGAVGFEPVEIDAVEIAPAGPVPAAPTPPNIERPAFDLLEVEPLVTGGSDGWETVPDAGSPVDASPLPLLDVGDAEATGAGAPSASWAHAEFDADTLLDFSEPDVPGAGAGAPTVGRAAEPSLVFLDVGADAPPAPVALRWADALPDEPPPLRLAPLLRLDAVPSVGGAVAPDTVPDVGVLPNFAPDTAVDLGMDVALASELEMVARDLPWAVPADDAGLASPLVEALVVIDPVAGEVEVPTAVLPAAGLPAAPSPDEDLLDLGAWLRETTPEPTTRLTTTVVPQTGDEQADFDATLRAFTAGVGRAVDHEDFDSHYDLGVAFREMGLLDEAIVEFQRAARAPGRPLRALEALAQCFLDARQPEVALLTLEAPAAEAARAGVGDASLVAVHYLMGAAAQALGRPDDARRWFVRVVATDVRFRDAAARLAALPPPSPVR